MFARNLIHSSRFNKKIKYIMNLLTQLSYWIWVNILSAKVPRSLEKTHFFFIFGQKKNTKEYLEF